MLAGQNILSSVCETHDDRPWDDEKACGCGGAGMPCPSCNVSNPDNPPRLPAGFQRDESLDDELSGPTYGFSKNDIRIHNPR
jgi:hypothetical protein